MTRWVAGSNPVDGRSLNEGWGMCLCSRTWLVVSVILQAGASLGGDGVGRPK